MKGSKLHPLLRQVPGEVADVKRSSLQLDVEKHAAPSLKGCCNRIGRHSYSIHDRRRCLNR